MNSGHLTVINDCIWSDLASGALRDNSTALEQYKTNQRASAIKTAVSTVNNITVQLLSIDNHSVITINKSGSMRSIKTDPIQTMEVKDSTLFYLDTSASLYSLDLLTSNSRPIRIKGDISGLFYYVFALDNSYEHALLAVDDEFTATRVDLLKVCSPDGQFGSTCDSLEDVVFASSDLILFMDSEGYYSLYDHNGAIITDQFLLEECSSEGQYCLDRADINNVVRLTFSGQAVYMFSTNSGHIYQINDSVETGYIGPVVSEDGDVIEGCQSLRVIAGQYFVFIDDSNRLWSIRVDDAMLKSVSDCRQIVAKHVYDGVVDIDSRDVNNLIVEV